MVTKNAVFMRSVAFCKRLIILKIMRGNMLHKDIFLEFLIQCSLATPRVINLWRKTHRLACGMKAPFHTLLVIKLWE